MDDDTDQTAPARGIVWGLFFSIIFWAGLYLLVGMAY